MTPEKAMEIAEGCNKAYWLDSDNGAGKGSLPKYYADAILAAYKEGLVDAANLLVERAYETSDTFGARGHAIDNANREAAAIRNLKEAPQSTKSPEVQR